MIRPGPLAPRPPPPVCGRPPNNMFEIVAHTRVWPTAGVRSPRSQRHDQTRKEKRNLRSSRADPAPWDVRPGGNFRTGALGLGDIPRASGPAGREASVALHQFNITNKIIQSLMIRLGYPSSRSTSGLDSSRFVGYFRTNYLFISHWRSPTREY